MKKHGGVKKIFAYTLLLLVLMSLAAGGLFARQFLRFYRSQQERQLVFALRPVITAIEHKPLEEMQEIVRAFAERNQSYQFVIRGNNGDVLFATPGTIPLDDLPAEPSPAEPSSPPALERQRVIRENLAAEEPQRVFTQVTTSVKASAEGGEGYTLTGFVSPSVAIDYHDLIGRCLLALALMLFIALFGALLFAKKITRPLEAELEREQIMEENQRLFFSAASHELKTPIAAARAMVEGMLAGVGGYQDHPKYLRECIRTLDAQSELVSEILELVKLDEWSGGEALPLDLEELCGAVLAEYRPIAEQRGLSIETALYPAKIRADRQLLYRVLSNVIANAAQNTQAGGVIRVWAENRDRGTRLFIRNTGTPIPEALIPRLFDPFYRADAARTRKDGRSGLGLAIVKKALDRMGIPFALENTAGGVCFRMDLPALSAPRAVRRR